mgnify:CR=1 FL=1
MKARIWIVLIIIVLVLCLVAYLVGTGTQIRADQVRRPEEGSEPALPDDGLEKTGSHLAGDGAAGAD